MSLSVAGVWAVDVWDQTVWAEGVWREGEYTSSYIMAPAKRTESTPAEIRCTCTAAEDRECYTEAEKRFEYS